MKWLDDIKKRATEDAGRAAARAVLDQTRKQVESFAEGLLEAGERALEERTREAAARRAAPGPELPAAEEPAPPEEDHEEAPPAEEPPVEPEPATEVESEAEAEEVLDLGRELRSTAGNPPASPESRPLERLRREIDLPPAAPVPVRADPLDAANAALERAREARRKIDPDGFDRAAAAALAHATRTQAPVIREDPIARAERLLREAAEARAQAGVSPRARAREEAARKELARLKAGGLPDPTPGSEASPAPQDDPPPARAPDSPRKRTL